MKRKFIYRDLDELYENAPSLDVGDGDRIVIFSDLHMGNGGKQDDFKKNAALFSHVLQHEYPAGETTLILNGDIEELYKFRLRDIWRAWASVFEIFRAFKSRPGGLFKTIGNHDFRLVYAQDYPLAGDLIPALRLSYGKESMFVFHGHQVSGFADRYNPLIGYLVRYFARPLGIKNYTTAYSSPKKFKVEQKIHEFSNSRRIISIIGHTHRPLFESLSKIDMLKFKIEELLRKYTAAGGPEKAALEEEILQFKEELILFRNKHSDIADRSGLYDVELIIPSLFNSGCGIGKRGVTGLEISGGRIALVYFYDEQRVRRYLEHRYESVRRLGKGPYFKAVIKSDYLRYIFSRVKLLSE